MSNRLYSLSACLIVSAALLTACNKKEKEAGAQGQPAAEAAAPITITGNDQMQYSTKTIEVTAGSQVTVIMQNVGTMPKESMAHNFTLLQQGTVLADFANKAMAAKDNGYIPAGDPAIIAHTKLVGPGESDTVKFTAPPAGQYPYMCTFPGHFAVMNGILTSK